MNERMLIMCCGGMLLLFPQAKNHAQEMHDGFQRAGNPQEISVWARPTNVQGSIGYYVGGGAVSRRHGEAPFIDEGTWGWDHRGWWLPRRVDLLWWHGRRTQGGVGAYKTDEPKLPALREGS